jgi:hypothetical protein
MAKLHKNKRTITNQDKRWAALEAVAKNGKKKVKKRRTFKKRNKSMKGGDIMTPIEADLKAYMNAINDVDKKKITEKYKSTHDWGDVDISFYAAMEAVNSKRPRALDDAVAVLSTQVTLEK